MELEGARAGFEIASPHFTLVCPNARQFRREMTRNRLSKMSTDSMFGLTI